MAIRSINVEFKHAEKKNRLVAEMRQAGFVESKRTITNLKACRRARNDGYDDVRLL
jgi:hypothetical protein